MSYKPRTRAICRKCGKEMMRNQVINHWLKEHKKEFYEIGESIPGGWGGIEMRGKIWIFLADALPGEVK